MNIKLAIFTATATLMLCGLVGAKYDLFYKVVDETDWHTTGDNLHHPGRIIWSGSKSSPASNSNDFEWITIGDDDGSSITIGAGIVFSGGTNSKVLGGQFK